MKLSKRLTFSDGTVQATALPITQHASNVFGFSPIAQSAGQGGLVGNTSYWFGQATYGGDGATLVPSTSTWTLESAYSRFVGTYTFVVYWTALPNTGIVKHELSKDGGATWTTLGSGVDTYSGGSSTTTASLTIYTGVTIPEGASLQFRITVTGKNAGSSQYFYAINGWELARTGP